MMQITVNISKTLVDESFMNIIKCINKTKTLSKSFIVDVPEGCCTSPFKIGQSIRLKSNGIPITIDKYSQIIYDITSKTWDIKLPNGYYSNIDYAINMYVNDFGFEDKNPIEKTE